MQNAIVFLEYPQNIIVNWNLNVKITDNAVIPSEAMPSRGILALCFVPMEIRCEDPSTALRFARDDNVF